MIIARGVLASTAIASAIAAAMALSHPVSRAVALEKPLDLIIALAGRQAAPDMRDLTFALRYRPASGEIIIVALPPQTQIAEKQRLRDIYYTATHSSGPAQARRAVSAATRDLLADRFSPAGVIAPEPRLVASLIDRAGGVLLDGSDIARGTGTVTLNGAAFLQTARAALAATDAESARRLQALARAAIETLSRPRFQVRLLWTAAHLARGGDFSAWELFTLLLDARFADPARLRLALLPGQPAKGLWVSDPAAVGRFIDSMDPPVGELAVPAAPVRIEVWNASGRAGLADRAVWLLRGQGFDVVDWGTLSVVQKKTIICDYSGRHHAARRAAIAMACGEVVTRYEPGRFAQISIALGQDCRLEARPATRERPR